jgi:penicillin-binding protein 1B
MHDTTYSPWPRSCCVSVKVPEMPEVNEITTETPLTGEREQSKIHVPGFFERREGRLLAAWVLVLFAGGICVFGYFFLQYAHMIDQRLAAGPFSNTVSIFSAPRSIAAGDPLTQEEVVERLRHSGYSTSRGNTMGWYNVRPHAVEIFPGRDSFTGGGEPGVVEFAEGRISRIVSLSDHTERKTLELEPQLITNLSENREKRRLIRFSDIPASLVHALVSVEDKHFFQHSGIDLPRIFKAGYVDLKSGRKDQGASTITMQLARGFWLEPEKSWSRKLQELLIAMHLEEKLSKQQIFEYYANEVYLGRHATFSVNGFAEGARTYFGKDLSQLKPEECALLAGMVQRPSYYNPYRYPERARDRRNLVLSLMRQNGYLSSDEYRRAVGAPVTITPERSENMESQYFVDLMNNEMQSKFDDSDKQIRYVYTTLDQDLQVAAQEAVDVGMKVVDKQLHNTSKKKKTSIPPGQPQVALIALDPHTGEVKAMVGGRDYRTSQLNHVLAMRQPGSAFKPFVYAAALDTAVQGGQHIFTPASLMSDEPTTFVYENQTYQPGNFHHESMGDVTLRTALAHSLNVVAVRLAQQVGYAKVVDIGRRAGLNDAIKPTPSVALGAYETTPFEIAGAYTVFANQGMHVTPTTISLARGPDGKLLYQRETKQKRALDPRVAYLMVNMMQDVLRSGTGAGVHSYGFNLPAAGKTGTSRDGWFAGFTSELLCVVWVGFDDNRELNLEGARSALPVWAEFMKRAAKLREYRDARPFKAPPGIVSAEICADSGQRATGYCPNVRNDVFITGTQPVADCEMHSFPTNQYADRVTEISALPTPTVTTGKRSVPMQTDLPRPIAK